MQVEYLLKLVVEERTLQAQAAADDTTMCASESFAPVAEGKTTTSLSCS